ncbi:polysaccharide pyruvyl transferase family protein [Chenggangzhangella methanolivorans]|uniref:Polysaccharide pyruvyl transferase family protein n=1 Tax=Chenggangzhangella methanolivorans TaxID=1437009 RepID=A0A9E6REZ9_9HYPH|nr:polysaccharide pyruvyl transferase family protein [Chenggangzhangella methanolivorans]QZN99721.1 polysaccharide pyruvyl transferase family protein [Chenggangzhangella methanolivorans]
MRSGPISASTRRRTAGRSATTSLSSARGSSRLRRSGDPEVVNRYSALVIGGGGLLASVHRPMDSQSWVESVKIPIILLSLGVSEDALEKCRPLVERAEVVSGRDDFSCEMISRIRSDVRYLNDPILTDPRLDAAPAPTRPGRLTVIPRKQTDRYRQVYTLLEAELAPDDLVVSMFPATDEASGVFDTFPASPTARLTTMSELCEQIDGSGVVVSSRYHGCIIALKRGRRASAR